MIDYIEFWKRFFEVGRCVEQALAVEQVLKDAFIFQHFARHSTRIQIGHIGKKLARVYHWVKFLGQQFGEYLVFTVQQVEAFQECYLRGCPVFNSSFEGHLGVVTWTFKHGLDVCIFKIDFFRTVYDQFAAHGCDFISVGLKKVDADARQL